MAWYDGTEDVSRQELEEKFPVEIAPTLRMNGERNKLAIINDYPKGGRLYELSDPRMEISLLKREDFLHFIVGNEAAGKAATALEKFLEQGCGKGEYYEPNCNLQPPGNGSPARRRFPGKHCRYQLL